MGGLVIDTVRPGVQFTSDAAEAFRRAEAQLGRQIDVNSTYRSWATQLKMYNDWNAYVAGREPYPGHSKAVHPSESFHVQGVALDSDDWTNARVRAILEENGFIRNRLYVPNEQHHFEYIRARDKNYGKPIPDAESGGSGFDYFEEDDMDMLYFYCEGYDRAYVVHPWLGQKRPLSSAEYEAALAAGKKFKRGVSKAQADQIPNKK